MGPRQPAEVSLADLYSSPQAQPLYVPTRRTEQPRTQPPLLTAHSACSAPSRSRQLRSAPRRPEGSAPPDSALPGAAGTHRRLALRLRFQSVQAQAAAELLVLQGEAACLFPQPLVLPQQPLVLRIPARGQIASRSRPASPGPALTSSSSSTTCCSSSVIRAFFLSLAL